MSEPDVEMHLDFTLLGETQGELRQVMIGAGVPGIMIQPKIEGGAIRFEVTAGGFETSEQVAEVLYVLAATLDPSIADPDD